MLRSHFRSLPALVLLALLFGATAAQAHRLKVFAFAEGARIEGSAYFSGGGGAAGARIRIEDGGGRVLAEPALAPDGSFHYQAGAPVDHLVVATTADGHRAQWRIGAAELAGGFPGQRVAADPAPAEPAGAADPPVGVQGLDPGFQAAIERAVGRQLRPLRKELIATRDDLRLRDVLGGIGYIFGVFGLALWWRDRRSGRRP